MSLGNLSDADLNGVSEHLLIDEIVRLRDSNSRANSSIDKLSRRCGRQGGVIDNCIRWIGTCQDVILHGANNPDTILRQNVTQSLDALIIAKGE